jgi:hypothetical protein
MQSLFSASSRQMLMRRQYVATPRDPDRIRYVRNEPSENLPTVMLTQPERMKYY